MNHHHFMQRCLELAALGTGNVAPNPLVGCVIVHAGKIIGEGYHQKCGEGHAEVNAFNSVQDDSLLPESTVYVSLEPCAHHGKTPPCAELLVEKKIKHVVIATLDPHAKVAGLGVEILRNAGIEVTVGILEKEARFLARRFFTFHQNKRPFVVLKWAESADGFLDKERTTSSQEPLSISCEESNVHTHGLRASEHAIMVGTNTALLDNPSLAVRNASGSNPIRIVLDRTLRLPQTLKLFTDGKPTVVLNEMKSGKEGAIRFVKPNEWTLTSMLSELHQLQIQSVLVEGGSKLLNSFVSGNFWDEAHCISSSEVFAKKGPLSPKIIAPIRKQFQSGSDSITVYQNQLTTK
ncbi:MAG: diaminohydroxyphosphoribosylaminopyrimidine deaminase [Granulosicoccus sp.]|jgi:diaminohydroxyphosphoribosylaminopyrimidine deaminase/5-amino-6-(5-phosphoribosylamino)uracil reductase